MKYVVKPADTLLKRADVKFNLCEEHFFSDSKELGELKEIVVRDPMCYGFQYCNIGIPMIRIGDFEEPFINFCRVANVSEIVYNKFSKTHLKPMDILMSVRGVSTGRIAVFMGETPKANISPNVIIIRLKSKELVPYVASILITDIGQKQIAKITSGSSKPTITATMINSIKIPFHDDMVVKKVSDLFMEMYKARMCKKKLNQEVNKLIETALDNKNVGKKQITYMKNLSGARRWDAHFHQKCFQDIYNYINEFGGKKLKDIVEPITDVLDIKVIDEKIRYIEISDVNCLDASISSEAQIDYVKKLPSGGKIKLMNEDILISKVRPYRKGFTIFKENDKLITTASKNGFAVFRTTSYEYPYFLLAFLRSEYGLNQIIMHESGTSYPTVDETDIANVIIPDLPEELIEKINNLYANYLNSKKYERDCFDSINELLNSI